MSTSNEIMAVDLDEINSECIVFGEKKTRSWSFNDPTGKLCSGSQNYVIPYYMDGEERKRFVFVVKDVISYQGVQIGSNPKKGFMSFKLTSELSKKLKAKIDDKLLDFSFKHRSSLLKKDAHKVTSKELMSIGFTGVVRGGQMKTDGSNAFWDDDITATVSMKKKMGAPVVDADQLEIQDSDMKPYSWTSLDGKKVAEVAVEIERLVFSDKVKAQLIFRLIVVDEKTPPKFTTKSTQKRKLDMTGEVLDEGVANNSVQLQDTPPPVSSVSYQTPKCNEANQHKDKKTRK
jgi:hypothetical protein